MPHRATRAFTHANQDLDAILVLNDAAPDPSFFWGTDLVHGGVYEGSMAVFYPRKKPVAIVPPLEEESAKAGMVTVKVYKDRGSAMGVVGDALGDAKRVGLDLAQVSVTRHQALKKAFPKITFVDASEALARARIIKDDVELKRIRKACRFVSDLAKTIPDRLVKGMTERQLAASLVHDMLASTQGPSFETIVGFGKTSAEPHYRPQGRKLTKGAVLVDMGCKVDGYCSDLTRTFHADVPPKWFESMYWTVHEAMEAAIAAIKPGVKAKDVDRAARDVVEASEFKGRFIHGTGHGLGIEIHDPGSLNPMSDLVLEAGMVMTVEPGIYLTGQAGVRIEQDVLVTPRGRTVLTNAPTDLAVIGL